MHKLLLFLFLSVATTLMAATHIPLNNGWTWHHGFQGSGIKVELPHTWNQEDAMFGNTDYFMQKLASGSMDIHIVLMV